MGKKKPATIVIELFGGVRPLARLLSRTPGAISKWQATGLIPSKHHEKLLDMARAKRLHLTAEMLICGV